MNHILDKEDRMVLCREYLRRAQSLRDQVRYLNTMKKGVDDRLSVMDAENLSQYEQQFASMLIMQSDGLGLQVSAIEAEIKSLEMRAMRLPKTIQWENSEEGPKTAYKQYDPQYKENSDADPR